MSLLYELVIFTAAMPDYANWVIDTIDPTKLIKFRLFRQHTIRDDILFLKDLGRLGRSLSKVIIIDNVAENFSL